MIEALKIQSKMNYVGTILAEAGMLNVTNRGRKKLLCCLIDWMLVAIIQIVFLQKFFFNTSILHHFQLHPYIYRLLFSLSNRLVRAYHSQIEWYPYLVVKLR
jgi:hypothetical protein